MSTISEVIEVWMKVQAKWMYLEAIFIGSEDIRLQLPEEAKRFDRIHNAFKKTMAEAHKNPNVLDCCTVDGRLAALQGLFSQLEACQKSLSDYLETKRTVFPRFYFLSDDELLQILGTSDPTAVQEHMLKLFDNVAAISPSARRAPRCWAWSRRKASSFPSRRSRRPRAWSRTGCRWWRARW